MPSEELLFIPNVEQWTLNTPMACSPLPPGSGYSPRYSGGIMAHLDEVIQQWKDARAVNPLRIVLAGAPRAGERDEHGRGAGTAGDGHSRGKHIQRTRRNEHSGRMARCGGVQGLPYLTG